MLLRKLFPAIIMKHPERILLLKSLLHATTSIPIVIFIFKDLINQCVFYQC